MPLTDTVPVWLLYLVFQKETVSRSVWDYKPWWCQPYTILATGLVIVRLTYQVSNGSWLWTGGVACCVAWWWYTFLIVYPAEFEVYMNDADQRDLPSEGNSSDLPR